MVSEGEALVNTLRDEMEKNSLLREQLSKKDAIIEVLEREKRELERELSQKQRTNESTLELMTSMQRSQKEQVDVLLQRITFLESKIGPCEKEAEAAEEVRQALEVKTAECAELTEAIEELEREMQSISQSAQEKVTKMMEEESRTYLREMKRLEEEIATNHATILELQQELERKGEQLSNLEEENRILVEADNIKEEVFKFLEQGHVDKAGEVKMRNAGRQLRIALKSPRVRSSGHGSLMTPRSGTSSKSDKVAPQRSSTSRHSMLEPAPTRPSLVPRLPVGDAMHKQFRESCLSAREYNRSWQLPHASKCGASSNGCSSATSRSLASSTQSSPREEHAGFGQNNVLDHEEEEATVQKGAADRTSSKKSQQPSTPSKSLKSSADRHSKSSPLVKRPELSDEKTRLAVRSARFGVSRIPIPESPTTCRRTKSD